MAKKNLKSIIAAGLVGASSLFLPTKVKSDLVDVFLYEPSREDVGGSMMTLRNMEGGELGYDDIDDPFWPGRPPGSPDVWLRVYSDQWKVYYNESSFPPIRVDARPYSGPDANQPFPLRADVQGLGEGETISANNCYFTFQAQNGYGTNGGYRDEGLRDIYTWTLSLNPTYAQFTDGSYTKSGSFDLRQGQTFNTPAFNIYNVPGNTKFLEWTLQAIPEPSTISFIGLAGGAALLGRRLRRKKEK
ncbi:MAG: PEP-CTERM sorting domain-containing protein [Candidatus Pacearchaeota archaeon]